MPLLHSLKPFLNWYNFPADVAATGDGHEAADDFDYVGPSLVQCLSVPISMGFNVQCSKFNVLSAPARLFNFWMARLPDDAGSCVLQARWGYFFVPERPTEIVRLVAPVYL